MIDSLIERLVLEKWSNTEVLHRVFCVPWLKKAIWFIWEHKDQHITGHVTHALSYLPISWLYPVALTTRRDSGRGSWNPGAYLAPSRQWSQLQQISTEITDNRSKDTSISTQSKPSTQTTGGQPGKSWHLHLAFTLFWSSLDQSDLFCSSASLRYPTEWVTIVE